MQLTKLFNQYEENNLQDDKNLETEYKKLQKDVKDLRIRLGLGKIDQETYEITYEHLNEQIQKISKEVNNAKVKISNLEELLKKALKKLENISKIWGCSDLEEKRILQKTMFPEGIFFDAENHIYRTRNPNQFIEAISLLSMRYEPNKKADSQNKFEKFATVERKGFEPSKQLPVYTLSRRAPSTTRTPLCKIGLQK